MEHNQAVAEMAAEKYVLNELGNGERDQFEEHYFSCTDCAQDVRDLAGLAEGARVLLTTRLMIEQTGIDPGQRASWWLDVWRLPWLRLQPGAGLAWASAL